MLRHRIVHATVAQDVHLRFLRLLPVLHLLAHHPNHRVQHHLYVHHLRWQHYVRRQQLLFTSIPCIHWLYFGDVPTAFVEQRRRDGRSHQLSNQLQRHLLRRDYRQQITSGWAVVSANFAPTDTTCSAAATGGTVYALGTCIPSGTNNGFILTADVRPLYTTTRF